jgi:polysaccharide export outer membrane protein
MFNRVLMRNHANVRILFTTIVTMIMMAQGASHLSAASESPQVGQVARENGLRLSQAEALRRFEEASTTEYTLGAGDEIEILIPDHADLQGRHVLGPDGRITLPFAGPIQISGQTREQAAQSITKAWNQYYSSINCSVQVLKYGSNRIILVGRVATPGPLYFDTAPTLLEVLAKGGTYGTRPRDGVKSTPVSNPDSPPTMISRCAIYRGSDQVLWIDMKELFASGAGVDLHLRRDDVVYVPDEQDDLVSVLGQVQHPGAVRLTVDTRFIDVLALAGGLTEDAASNKILLVHSATGMTREVSLNQLLHPSPGQTNEIALERGDVVYVPKSGVGKLGYVLGKFGNAGSLLTFAALAAGR